MLAIMEAKIILMNVIRLLTLEENRITGLFKMAGILEQFSDTYVAMVIRKAILKSRIYKKCINYLQMYLDKLKSKREQTEPLDYTE